MANRPTIADAVDPAPELIGIVDALAVEGVEDVQPATHQQRVAPARRRVGAWGDNSVSTNCCSCL